MITVVANVTGVVNKILKQPGDAVTTGEALFVLESMKMEVHVEATAPGVVREICCRESQSISDGDILMVLD